MSEIGQTAASEIVQAHGTRMQGATLEFIATDNVVVATTTLAASNLFTATAVTSGSNRQVTLQTGFAVTANFAGGGNKTMNRYQVRNGTTLIERGTVTATGGGGDATVDNTSIASGQVFNVTGWTIRIGFVAAYV